MDIFILKFAVHFEFLILVMFQTLSHRIQKSSKITTANKDIYYHFL